MTGLALETVDPNEVKTEMQARRVLMDRASHARHRKRRVPKPILNWFRGKSN